MLPLFCIYLISWVRDIIYDRFNLTCINWICLPKVLFFVSIYFFSLIIVVLIGRRNILLFDINYFFFLIIFLSCRNHLGDFFSSHVYMDRISCHRNITFIRLWSIMALRLSFVSVFSDVQVSLSFADFYAVVECPKVSITFSIRPGFKKRSRIGSEPIFGNSKCCRCDQYSTFIPYSQTRSSRS